MKKRQNTQKTGLFSAVGLALLILVAAGLILVVTADTTPTTESTRRLFGLWRLPHFALGLGVFGVGLGGLAYARSRDAFLGFVTSAGVTLLFLAALEAMGRVGVVDWSSLLLPSRGASEGAGWTAQPDLHVTGETYQDIAVRVGLPSDPIAFEYRTDHYGFRNKDDGPADVIVLGDSIVLGAQVDRSKTVDALLADMLDRPVMQVALLGLSIQEQHDLLLETGIDLSGKTVIQFLFEGNDLLDSASYRNRSDSGDVGPARTSLIKSAWSIAAAATDPTTALETADYCLVDDQPHLFLWLRRSFDGYIGEVPYIQDAIVAFAETVNQAGGDYKLVYVPTKFRVMHNVCTFPPGSRIADVQAHLSPLPQIMGRWASEAQIPYLDITSALQAEAEAGRRPWFWGDTHWQEAGHAIAAQALAQWNAQAQQVE